MLCVSNLSELGGSLPFAILFNEALLAIQLPLHLQ